MGLKVKNKAIREYIHWQVPDGPFIGGKKKKRKGLELNFCVRFHRISEALI